MNHCTGVIQGKIQALSKVTKEEEIKTLYQSLRILNSTVKILKTSTFDVILPKDEAQFLLSVRNGEVEK